MKLIPNFISHNWGLKLLALILALLVFYAVRETNNKGHAAEFPNPANVLKGASDVNLH